MPKTHGGGPPTGFTILECVLAVAVLATVAAQILSVQSSSLSIIQASRDQLGSLWALRALESEIRYVNDVYGAKGLPREVAGPWSRNERFSFRVETTEPQVEASKLLFAAVHLAQAAKAQKSKEAPDVDPTDDLAGFTSMVDQQLPKDLLRAVRYSISWTSGELKPKSLEGGLVFPHGEGAKISLPGGLGK